MGSLGLGLFGEFLSFSLFFLVGSLGLGLFGVSPWVLVSGGAFSSPWPPRSASGLLSGE